MLYAAMAGRLQYKPPPMAADSQRLNRAPPTIPPVPVLPMNLALRVCLQLAAGWMACCALSPALLADEATPASAPSFKNDVLPLLTRYGCNQGACHGKMAGQNGFRLSLRGYAPEWDHGWIAREFDGRRIDRANPANSLLLKKVSGQMPHGGGRPLPVESAGFKLLHDWIAAGAPGPIADEAAIERLVVQPGQQTLTPGATVSLTVNAFYAGSRERDVTWLAKFYSNDESVVEVSPDGLVKALRAGETVVRVHFDNLVEVVVITIPYEQAVDPQLYAQRQGAIDEHVMNKLSALKIPPSAPADDATFLRRAYLDAIGTLPTAEEAAAFLTDTATDKRVKLVDQLLKRPEWTDYWTLQLCDLLQNRKERDHDVRGAKGVRSMHAWVREQVAKNRPWNELARDVITASGDTAGQPQIGYYIVTIGEQRRGEESEAASSVAQAFLGARIGCAKCHNHPLERYTQDDYFHFAAFFSRVSFDRQKPEEKPTELLVATEEEHRFHREIRQKETKIAELTASLEGKPPTEAEPIQKQIEEQQKQIESQQKQLAETKAQPLTVRQPRTGAQLPPQGLDRSAIALTPDQDPRAALADWMTSPANEQFSGAMVNRLWKHFFAVGLVEPVDDLRASNPPSNRELWTALNREFVGSGFNLKHIMRLIMNSRTYQLAGSTLPENQDDQRFYSHYYARRLPAEVLLDAISQCSGVPDEFAGYPVGLRAIQLPDPNVNSYFLGLFGRSNRVTACACERMGDVTLPQILHLQCGDALLTKLSDGQSNLKKWLTELPDDGALLERVFLTTLARRPTDEERTQVLAALAGYENREEAFRDVVWAVTNSKEFGFNH